MNWADFLANYLPSQNHKDDQLSYEVCKLALQAAQRDTYGVGAIIVSRDDEVLESGYNEVRIGVLRTDLHAEMVVLNRFESFDRISTIGECTLITSLEPCPMCTARILLSGVTRVRYLAVDEIGGMRDYLHALPPFFRDLALHEDQDWRLADCTATLREAAYGIWRESHDRIHR